MSYCCTGALLSCVSCHLIRYDGSGGGGGGDGAGPFLLVFNKVNNRAFLFLANGRGRGCLL